MQCVLKLNGGNTKRSTKEMQSDISQLITSDKMLHPAALIVLLKGALFGMQLVLWTSAPGECCCSLPLTFDTCSCRGEQF